ncbi:MAG: O-antigen ligase family protein [Pyrinomonadaceae bacterium]
MSDLANKQGGVSIEQISVGGDPSRISSAIFVLLCIVPMFATMLFGAVDSATWLILSVFWVLIVLLWLAESWNAGGFLISMSWIQLPIIGLILIAAVQLLPFGGDTSGSSAASSALSMDPYATRLFLIKLIVFLTFFAACLAFINSERRLKTIVILTIIFGAVLAFFAILQRLANPDGIYGMRATPQAIPFGPFVNQHHFAAFMQMTGGLTLGLLFGRGARRDRQIMLATAFVVMGVAVVFTSSRGGLLGFMTVAAFVSLLNLLSGRFSDRERTSAATGIQRKVAIAAGGLALIIVIFGTALLLGGNDNLLRGVGAVNADTDFSTGRLHFWPIAIRIFLEHPIIGAGFDAFAVAFTKYDTWNGQMRVEQAHNEYLQTLAEAGIAGIVCIGGFIFLLFRKGLAVIASAEAFRQSAAIGSLAGCLGIFVHSFFDFPLRTHSNAFFFLILAAVATVSVTESHQHRRRHRRRV